MFWRADESLELLLSSSGFQIRVLGRLSIIQSRVRSYPLRNPYSTT